MPKHQWWNLVLALLSVGAGIWCYHDHNWLLACLNWWNAGVRGTAFLWNVNMSE